MDGVRRFTKLAAGLALVGSLALSACDFEVVNPGPVQDQNVNEQGAHQGLVNGAIRSAQDGLGDFSTVSSALVHDMMASGHTGTAGVIPEEEVGLLNDEINGMNGAWGSTHQGRWIAEEAIRRFEATDGLDVNTYPLAAEAYLWAGLATRILGEMTCTAVFDGGEALPKLAYFDRAIEHFNMAEHIGNAAGLDDVATAAIGARAAANLFLGNYSTARTDAARVPLDFSYQTQYSGFSGDPNYYLFETVASVAFQSMSMWGTPAHPHFLMTGDSRVAWGYDNGSLEVPQDKPYAVRAQTHPARPTWTALVPMFYALKSYAPRNPARELRIFEPVLSAQRNIQIDLVDGREMALIMAEADLRDGNMASAMGHINRVRTSTPVYPANLATALDLTLHPQEAADKASANLPDYFTGTPGDFSGGGMMPPVTASTMNEAWAALKFERYLETHLETRRLGDRWRWRDGADPAPGALHPLEYVPQQIATRYGVPTDQLNLCFPMPRSENDANANIAEDYRDWRTP